MKEKRAARGRIFRGRTALLLFLVLMMLLPEHVLCFAPRLAGTQNVYASSMQLIARKRKKKKKSSSAASEQSGGSRESDLSVEEDGTYNSRDEVALYIHTYGKLPQNYITKREAEALGWSSTLGNLWEVAPGMSIGGSRFGNYEGLLPHKYGRHYYECDIDYNGGRRNAKRIVYSDDGLVFYTEDHYQTFEKLY